MNDYHQESVGFKPSSSELTDASKLSSALEIAFSDGEGWLWGAKLDPGSKSFEIFL
jgi:hypothetical protein